MKPRMPKMREKLKEMGGISTYKFQGIPAFHAAQIFDPFFLP